VSNNDDANVERDAQLMLYAVGEMPSARRAEFEAQLATDAALVEQLRGVREAMQRFETSLAELDARQRPPTSDAVTVRRAERAMQQWAVKRLRRPVERAATQRRMPWWSYPAAAAAIVVVSFIIWSDRQPVEPTEPTVSIQNEIMIGDAEALADRLDEEFARDSELATDDTPNMGGDELGTFFITPSEAATW
jgi:anti-sigma-K factor RskA